MSEPRRAEERVRPLTMVAIGLLLVIGDLNLGQFDLLPDVLGYLLVALGLFAVKERHLGFAVAAWTAAAMVPLWLLLFGQADLLPEGLAPAVITADEILQTVVEVGLLIGVRALTKRPSTRRTAGVIIVIDLAISAFFVGSTLVLPTTSQDAITVPGPVVAVLLGAFAVAVIAALLWLYRVGREPEFAR